MKRKIIAWILLAGFVLLILNLIIFRIYWQVSMVIYLVIVFAFILTNGKLIKANDSTENTYENQEEPEIQEDPKEQDNHEEPENQQEQ